MFVGAAAAAGQGQGRHTQAGSHRGVPAVPRAYTHLPRPDRGVGGHVRTALTGALPEGGEPGLDWPVHRSHDHHPPYDSFRPHHHHYGP